MRRSGFGWRGLRRSGLSDNGFWDGGIFVAVFPIVIDGGEGAEEKAVDVSEDGSAASGDAVGGQEAVDVGEGEVDALTGLKILRPGKEILGEIIGLLLPLQVAMMSAEAGTRIGGKLTALTAGGGAMRTTSDLVDGGSVGGLGFHLNSSDLD